MEPQDRADNSGGDSVGRRDHDTAGALCLCPSWAHGPECRVLPSPVPASSAPVLEPPFAAQQDSGELRPHTSAPQRGRPAARQTIRETQDITLPSWSKSSRAIRPACWPKQSRGSAPKALQLRPLTHDARDVSGGGDGAGAPANVSRLQGAYPRLIGADSSVVLWDLNEAQRQLNELHGRLLKREAELAILDKMLEHRRERSINNGCHNMPRRAALASRSRAWALWREHVSRQTLLQRQAALEHELASKQQQMADEQKKHHKVVEIMAKRLNEIPLLNKKIEQLKADIASQIRVKQLAEEAAKEKMQVLKDALNTQAAELKNLARELDARERKQLELGRNLKMRDRQTQKHRGEVAKLNSELQDRRAQLNRVLQHHILVHDESGPSAKKLAALHGFVMHDEEGIELFRQANARYYQADPAKTLGIYGTRDSFLCGLESINGRPLVINDDQLWKQIRQEFHNCTDPRVQLITTTNNGLVSTNLQTEWEFAAHPIAGKIYPGQYGHPESHGITIARNSTSLTELMNTTEAQCAQLMRAEVLALRLYTGPAYAALNGALREGRYVKGKRECPRTVYFDMPSLIENMVQEAGKEQWTVGSAESDWNEIWSRIITQMNLSDVLTVKMTAAMDAAALSPTTAVLINRAEKRVVIVEVTVQGSVWHKFKRSETLFMRRAPAEIKHMQAEKKKREKQRKAEEERKKKEREEEELKRWEEEQERKRREHAAQKSAQQDHGPVASAGASANEIIANPDGAHDVGGGNEHQETDPSAAATADLLNVEARAENDEFDVFEKMQDKYKALQESWAKLLGKDWHVGVYPVIAESFGEMSGVTATFSPVPEEWCCCSGNSGGECNCAGCIHALADALLIPAERRLDLATAVLKASVQGGCGKHDYGACLDPARCEKCRLGELWNCAEKRQNPCANCAPGADSFTYTIAAASSAIIKLSKHSTLPPSGLLFRGVEGLTLPFQHLDENLQVPFGASMDICQDFVEHAFCSASAKKAVALRYAGGTKCKSCSGQGSCEFWDEESGICTEHRATVLEIETGVMDKGADLQWVSQWPGDEESVLLPLSNFDVKGMRRESNINFLRVGLRSNFRTRTLEQTRTSRQTYFTCIVQELKQETEQLLRGVSNVIDAGTVSAMFDKIRNDVIEEACKYILLYHLQDLAEYFNAPERFGSAVDKLTKNWSAMMADVTHKLVKVIEPLILDLREHTQIGGSGNLDKRSAAADGPGNMDKGIAEEDIDVEDERDKSTENSACTYPDEALTRQRNEEETEKLKLEIEHLLKTALCIVNVIYLKAAARERDDNDDSKHVFNIVYDLHIYFSSFSSSAEVLSSIYEEKADILRRRREVQELKQAFECYTKALDLLEAQASRAPQVLFKKTSVGVLLREVGGSEEGYKDLFMDFMTCLGMLKKLEEENVVEKKLITMENLKLTANRDNTAHDPGEVVVVDEEFRRRSLLRADIEESIGVLFCMHMPDKLNDAPLSLLEALRIKIRWLDANYFETLGHLDKVLLELAKGQGYASIKHRLMPCTVFMMLVGAEENSSVQLSTLTEAVSSLTRDGEPFVKEWGCRAMRCVLETDEMVFEWQEGLQVIDAVVRAMSCHPEHLGVAEHACLTLATTLQKTDVWAQLFAHAPKRFGQTAQKIICLCVLALDVHKDSLQLHSAIIEVVHRIVTFTVDEGSKLGFALHEAQKRQTQDVLGRVIAGLDLVFENGQVTELALEILCKCASESERSRILIASAQGERVLLRVEDAHDASLERGSRIHALCQECKSKCAKSFQRARHQAQLLRTQHEVIPARAPIETCEESDEQDIKQLRCEKILVDVKNAVRSGNLTTARSHLKDFHENFVLGQCHKSVEETMWLLHHECQGMTALTEARRALDAGYPDSAQAALADADRELQKGDRDFYQLQKKELLSTAHKIMEYRRNSDELSTRHLYVTAGNAALQAAKDILTRVGEFEMDFAKVLDRAAENGNAATKQSHEKEEAVAANNDQISSSADMQLQSPAWRRGHLQDWSEQNWTPSAAGAPPPPPRGANGNTEGNLLLLASASTADATQDVATVDKRPAEGTKEEGKKQEEKEQVADPGDHAQESKTGAENLLRNRPEEESAGELEEKEGLGSRAADDDEFKMHSPFDRLAEVLARLLEAQEAFGKIGEDRRQEIEPIQQELTAFANAARGVLVSRVRQLLESGSVDKAHRIIARATDEFVKIEHAHDLDALDLETSTELVGKSLEMMDLARQVLDEKGVLPTYERMKPVHEHLEEAATLLESAICKGTVLFDTTPLKDDLASLRLDCADLLLMCPRPVNQETRDTYFMAFRQLQLAGSTLSGSTRGRDLARNLDKFRQEIAAAHTN